MKNVITKTEYLSIVGLMTLAKEARKRVEECEKAYIKIVDYPQKYGFSDSGHFGDAVWDDTSVEEILKREEIKIK